MNPQLIGISGRKRAGKDTAAHVLTTQHGYVRVAFADPLKRVMHYTNPVLHTRSIGTRPGTDDDKWRLADELRYGATDADPTGWENAKQNPEVRRLLQSHGAAIRRFVGADVWLDAAMRIAETCAFEFGAPVVIPDVRYHNEADYIRNAGGIVIRITRPDNPEDHDPTAQHISETALDNYNFDAVIFNNGSIEQLEQRIADVLTTERNITP